MVEFIADICIYILAKWFRIVSQLPITVLLTGHQIRTSDCRLIDIIDTFRLTPT